MLELLHYDFIRHALLAAILVNVACGIVGTYVVLNRIVFISGGISHAAFGGIGLGYLLGLNPVLTAIPFSLLAALGIGLVSRKTRLNEDAAGKLFDQIIDLDGRGKSGRGTPTRNLERFCAALADEISRA